MGVVGLLSFVSKHRCGTDVVSLKAVVKEGAMVIAVDGLAFLYSFSSSLGDVAVSILGGEYDLLAQEVRCFVEGMRGVGLEPIFFFDGVPEAIKRRTHLARRREEVAALGRTYARLNADVACNAPVKEEGWVPPPLAREHIQAILASMNVECRQSLSEADSMIAEFFVANQPRVYAVLSNDSDFLIYPVRFIAFDTLRRGPDGDYSAVVFEPNKTASFLGIQPSQLVLLSCLVGNDYTRSQLLAAGDYYAVLASKSAYRPSKSEAAPHLVIRHAAGFIKRFLNGGMSRERVMELVLQQLFRKKSSSAQRKLGQLFDEAMEKFASHHEHSPQKVTHARTLDPCMVRQYGQGKFDACMMGVLTTGEFWCRVLCTPSDVDDILYHVSRPIRAALYRFIDVGHAVTEYCQQGGVHFGRVMVEPVQASESVNSLVASIFDGTISGPLANEPRSRFLGMLALRFLIEANTQSEEPFLYAWEPFVLLAHLTCMDLGIRASSGSDQFLQQQHQQTVGTDDSKDLRRKQRRLLVKIPLGRTVLLSSLFQSVVWQMNMCLQVSLCRQETMAQVTCGIDAERLFCGSELNALYHSFYKYILVARGALDGPWTGRLGVPIFAETFVRQNVFAQNGEALALFEKLQSFVFYKGRGDRYKSHFPDDFVIDAQRPGKKKDRRPSSSISEPALRTHHEFDSNNSFSILLRCENEL